MQDRFDDEAEFFRRPPKKTKRSPTQPPLEILNEADQVERRIEAEEEDLHAPAERPIPWTSEKPHPARPAPLRPEAKIISGDRERGRVLMWRRTFGFIMPETGGKELFVHQQDLKMPGYRALEVDAIVTFKRARTDRGLAAVDVVPEGQGA